MSMTSDVHNGFDSAAIEKMEYPQLMTRYQQLRDLAIAKGEDADIEILKELVVLSGVLRRKSSGPPKAVKKKAIPTLDDL